MLLDIQTFNKTLTNTAQRIILRDKAWILCCTCVFEEDHMNQTLWRQDKLTVKDGKSLCIAILSSVSQINILHMGCSVS